jgi:hypothetical protein
MKTLRINFDYWWKRLTTDFTPEFIQFFFSAKLYNLIDWTHPPEYLEQELTAFFSEKETKKKITDKLIRFRLKNGKMKFVFVHIEFQGKSGRAFSRRMFWYYVYIMAKYRTTDITAIAIYTGDAITKLHNTFKVEQFGTLMQYMFNVYVVSTQNEADLMASDNPLAIAVLANLYVNQTRSELERRAEYKKKLFELAGLKGYSIEKTESLLTFVLYLMQLPEYLEAEMKSFYRKNKKSSNMAATQIKPSPRSKKERLADDATFIRDLTYEFAYGKSYEEIYEILYQQAKADTNSEQTKALEQKTLAIEQSIATMFQKTGWDAEKIADISGFPLDLVQKIVNTLKA